MKEETTQSVPYLSIIIPVYNRQNSLDFLLNELSKAILEGDFIYQIEVIVVDDYSDAIVTIVDYPFDMQLVRNKKNSGAPFSRERGFKLSKGRFLHFHDSDDSIDENWLKEVMGVLNLCSDIDLLMTGRVDVDENTQKFKFQRYFHKQSNYPEKIKSRLIYRNCMGPLGGVVFSRRVLKTVKFKPFVSCQDWQMYIDAMEQAKILKSRPDIYFIFNKAGDDRISHDARKKLLGHSQLAKVTSQKSPFKRSLRLFYLYTCKQHVFNKGGLVLKFYKKNRFKIIFTYLLVSVYWRLT